MKRETRLTLEQNPELTLIKSKCPNPNPKLGREYSYQLEDSTGALLVDHRDTLSMVATEFTLEDMIECYETEVANDTVSFYK